MELIKVLVIDDEKYNLDSLKMVLTEEGFSVDLADNADQGLKYIDKNEYHCVLMDLKMPGKDGFHALPLIKGKAPMLPVIILSAFGLENTPKIVRDLGAFEFIHKPPDIDDLILKVKNATELYKSRKKLESLRLGIIDSFFLKSGNIKMQTLYDQAKKIAPMDVPVMITGESGTGKDVLARYVHHNSKRSERPFIAINCSALPINLIESELFGYEKGAFTGADKSYKGLFMAATEGTLFLDEIGDMPAETQAKLLRVLETGEFHRIGSASPQKTNARIIAATNKDIQQQIKKDLFREDLYYRLNVVPLHIPPLRERTEDIPSLVQFFAEEFCLKNQLPKKGFSREAMEYMKTFQYNGNIRELKNICIKLTILSESRTISISDLESIVLKKDPDSMQGLLSLKTLKEFKAESEKLFIVQKLKENNYNISRTAEKIDAQRSNLYKKIEAYGIDIKN